jgi:hypothetical protein
MDHITNPFSPGAGAPPPELVGREPVLHQAHVLLHRTKAGKSEKSLLLTGLRGTGKTVLLNEVCRIAEAAGYRSIMVEAHEDKPLGPLLAPHLRTLLYELSRLAGTTHRVRRALSVLRSFIGTIKIEYQDVALSVDVDPETGAADSGDLEIDLPNLFIAVAEAAQDRGVAVALLIDEVQYFSSKELGALIMAMHKMQQRQLPLVLIGSGLPILPGLAGESKSYAERLFAFPEIGALSQADCAKALQDPARAAEAAFTPEALAEIYRVTTGYPYFVQEWGYQAWNHAPTPEISAEVVHAVTPAAIERLDKNFFRVRFDRLTPSEKRFLRAMADLGPKPQRVGAIADRMRVKVNSVGPVRAKLINKGMIYSPAHGDLAFTVPLFDQFMCRVMPSLDA